MKLTARHKRAIALEAVGKTAEEIAEEIGIKKGTFYNWRIHKDYKAELDKIIEKNSDDANRIIKRNLIAAAEKLGELLNAEKLTKFGEADDNTVRLGAAKEILDRVLGRSKERIDPGGGGKQIVLGLGPSQFAQKSDVK